MTIKRKQFQALLETVFTGLSFPRRRESIKIISKAYFRTASEFSIKLITPTVLTLIRLLMPDS
jgi:uncharacterized protein YozE (UPF0346 family)